MPPKKPPEKRPPIEEPTTPPAEAEVVPPSAQAKRLARNWKELNRGGAPVSAEFVQAALDQGLTAQDVRMVLRAQALGGPRTSASYSSPELLDYFTANPGEITGLLEAVRSTRDAPANYAEYLARGGEPGGYRTQGQLLQEGVLGIGGAREAYLSGTHRAIYEAEGNNPNLWYAQGEEWMNNFAAQEQADEGGADFGLVGMDANQLTSISSAAQEMLRSRANREAAYSDYFTANDLTGME